MSKFKKKMKEREISKDIYFITGNTTTSVKRLAKGGWKFPKWETSAYRVGPACAIRIIRTKEYGQFVFYDSAEFFIAMMKYYPEDVELLLFHPEILDGKYTK